MKKFMIKRKEKKKEKIAGKVRVSKVEKEEDKKVNLFLQYNNYKAQEVNMIEIDMVTEKEVNNNENMQESKEVVGIPMDHQEEIKKSQTKRINKMKVIKHGSVFKYEEIDEDITIEKEKGTGIKEEQRFKGTHSGDITIEANVINKFKSKSRTCNTIKIASKINRLGIRVDKMKNISFNRTEIKLYNIKDANRLLDLGHVEGEKAQINFRIPRRVKKKGRDHGLGSGTRNNGTSGCHA